jgi:hypothetical protein
MLQNDSQYISIEQPRASLPMRKPWFNDPLIGSDMIFSEVCDAFRPSVVKGRPSMSGAYLSIGT